MNINKNIKLAIKLDENEEAIKNLEKEIENNKKKHVELLLEIEKNKNSLKEEKFNELYTIEINQKIEKLEYEFNELNNLIEIQETNFEFLLQNLSKIMEEYLKNPLINLENKILNNEKFQINSNIILLCRKLMHFYITENFHHFNTDDQLKKVKKNTLIN